MLPWQSGRMTTGELQIYERYKGLDNLRIAWALLHMRRFVAEAVAVAVAAAFGESSARLSEVDIGELAASAPKLGED